MEKQKEEGWNFWQVMKDREERGVGSVRRLV